MSASTFVLLTVLAAAPPKRYDVGTDEKAAKVIAELTGRADTPCFARPEAFPNVVVAGSLVHDRGCTTTFIFVDGVPYGDRAEATKAFMASVFGQSRSLTDEDHAAVKWTADVLHAFRHVERGDEHGLTHSDDYESPRWDREYDRLAVTVFVRDPVGMRPKPPSWTKTTTYFDTKTGALIADDGRKAHYDYRCAQSPLPGIIVNGRFAHDRGCDDWSIVVNGVAHEDLTKATAAGLAALGWGKASLDERKALAVKWTEGVLGRARFRISREPLRAEVKGKDIAVTLWDDTTDRGNGWMRRPDPTSTFQETILTFDPAGRLTVKAGKKHTEPNPR